MAESLEGGACAGTPGASGVRSFRDPGGGLLRHGERILRLVARSGWEDFRAYASSSTTRQMLEQGNLVRTWAAENVPSALESPEEEETVALILEHEKIPFPNYPHEWPAEMLQAAGLLTLDLAQGWLSEGLGLKDATPFNIMFRGAQPVFLDVLSCERRASRNATWLAQAQFVRTFILPLLVSRFHAMRSDRFFISEREGLEPATVYQWLRPWQRLRPLALRYVTIPTWLTSTSERMEDGLYSERLVRSEEKARFILETMFRSLRNALSALGRSPFFKSSWSGYLESGISYEHEQFLAKEQFVKRVLSQIRPQRVLDVGCNTGHFSRLAAAEGAAVVAVDMDPVVVGEVWQQAASLRQDILPLVVNVAQPTPAVGWANQECLSFLERAEGFFDCVLMLALLHHLLVTERVPMREVLGLAARLTRRYAVIEFVGAADPLFRRLTKGRQSLYAHISKEFFEQVATRYFHILSCQQVPGAERWLYLLERTRS